MYAPASTVRRLGLFGGIGVLVALAAGQLPAQAHDGYHGGSSRRQGLLT
jgi:hypothetical protein